ncbi:hypothetical protein G7Z17_g408 [Cylindrodendrum hubeiense]|uniref:Uncharacterized protein n=1 Tax=Cylindrodendrum hubeiense TaxID=595255 RepID=A0A9P5HNF7_9HYPO|nr:hypothetical protein G7Z17_g408 [Cylindrodendrum hubeiense]
MAASIDYPICTICGIRLHESSALEKPLSTHGPSPWYPDMWRTSAIAISGPRWPSYAKAPVADGAVTRYVADPSWYPGGVSIKPDGPTVFTQTEYASGDNDNINPTAEDHWYFGIHSACEDIANVAMRKSREARIRTTADLWMTLDQRCTKTDSELRFFTPFLPNIPENRPGEPLNLSLRRYYLPHDAMVGDDDDFGGLYEWWEDDPLFIPELTARIVSNLEKCKPTDDACLQSRNQFENLPQEIKDPILAELLNQPLPLGCNYSIPQSYWKQAFLEIPFLWDLDKGILDEKTREAESTGTEWDWEMITRQLMTPVTMVDDTIQFKPITWNYDQVGLAVPHGLNNRRRIWQILEEMYPDDLGMETEFENPAEESDDE